MLTPEQRQRAEEALINYAKNVADSNLEERDDFFMQQHKDYLKQFSDTEIKIALGQVGLTHLLED